MDNVKTATIAVLTALLLLASRAEASTEEANRLWLEAFESASAAKHAAAVGIITGIVMTADVYVTCPTRTHIEDLDAVAADVAKLIRMDDRFALVENTLIAYAVRGHAGPDGAVAAHCHLGLGKLYRRTGPREQAQAHLTTATTMYGEMGMTYWLEQAGAEF